MIDYRFGDRVKHSEYGRCIFGSTWDNEEKCIVWGGFPSEEYCINVSDLTPDDPRIIQINGVWHRVYTPLDVEEARKLIGKEVRYSESIHNLLLRDLRILKAVTTYYKPFNVYGDRWEVIAVSIESEPKKKPKPESRVNPLFQPILDAIYQANREMEEKG